jgi:8-hydroxy-5-deazaflavin:NADPH oxidoreductase
MNAGILGSGTVGRTLAAGCARQGHAVMIGTRDPAALLARTADSPRGGMSFARWHQENPKVAVGTFAEAASYGEILANATAGSGSLAALGLAGESNMAGKLLLDVSNPLDFSRGFPPSLTVSNTDSLGEQIQKAFPRTKVVKTLNTVTAALMVDPGQIAGEHAIFVCGNDAEAKKQAIDILKRWFGWKQVIDLGDITNARGTEMYLPLWVRLYGALGSPVFNVRIVTGPAPGKG